MDIKSGERNAGRAAPNRVVHVQDVKCPGWQGNHQRVNLKSGTACIKCGVSWADLDMELNGARP